MNNKTKKIVFAALMAALVYVATTIIRIPSPTEGFIHPGDGIVFLSGILLGPLYGGIAAGIGSMFVDLLAGYTHYVLGTLLIKLFAAMACGALFKILSTTCKNIVLRISISSLVGAVIIVLGYFGYASLYLGKGIAAAASIPGNIAQTIFGVVTVSILYPVLMKTNLLQILSE
ncbi:ECF transporter S component [Anaerosporobacter faecicola]|uniref:ECF transporter S component n=1 Tax=Anaerosporobacter faecicola TaxID=2718714 RepID=UPI00143C7DC4|nr:ECF transporter S component [Anaerosporobacter faecicola]